MKEYKVMTQNDRFFSGKFDTEKLEAAMNSYGSEGWEFKGVVTPVFGAPSKEIIVIFERDKK
jgi:Domain of unknown function (DUF4177)